MKYRDSGQKVCEIFPWVLKIYVPSQATQLSGCLSCEIPPSGKRGQIPLDLQSVNVMIINVTYYNIYDYHYIIAYDNTMVNSDKESSAR